MPVTTMYGSYTTWTYNVDKLHILEVDVPFLELDLLLKEKKSNKHLFNSSHTRQAMSLRWCEVILRYSSINVTVLHLLWSAQVIAWTERVSLKANDGFAPKLMLLWTLSQQAATASSSLAPL